MVHRVNESRRKVKGGRCSCLKCWVQRKLLPCAAQHPHLSPEKARGPRSGRAPVGTAVTLTSLSPANESPHRRIATRTTEPRHTCAAKCSMLSLL